MDKNYSASGDKIQHQHTSEVIQLGYTQFDLFWEQFLIVENAYVFEIIKQLPQN